MAEDKIFTVNAWKALLNNLITKFKTKHLLMVLRKII